MSKEFDTWFSDDGVSNESWTRVNVKQDMEAAFTAGRALGRDEGLEAEIERLKAELVESERISKSWKSQTLTAHTETNRARQVCTGLQNERDKLREAMEAVLEYQERVYGTESFSGKTAKQALKGER